MKAATEQPRRRFVRQAASLAFLLFAALLVGLPAAASIPKTPGSIELTTSSPTAEASEPLLRHLRPLLHVAPESQEARHLGFAENLSLLGGETRTGGFALFAVGACGLELTYARNNPLKYVDPDGYNPVVGWTARLVENGVKRLTPFFEKAFGVQLRKSGEQVLWSSKARAKAGEIAAHGKDKLLRHKGHSLPGGGKGNPHFQTEGVTGHSFWGKSLVVFGLVLDPWNEAEAAGPEDDEGTVEVLATSGDPRFTLWKGEQTPFADVGTDLIARGQALEALTRQVPSGTVTTATCFGPQCPK